MYCQILESERPLERKSKRRARAFARNVELPSFRSRAHQTPFYILMCCNIHICFLY